MNKKPFYITTTLPYVNADPHIGFAMEIIQADVVARAKRAQGFEVFFNTGTDEHGVKIYRKAQEAKMDPKTYCDHYAKRFYDLKTVLQVSYDNFIRTTDEHHIKAAQVFWLRCEKNGDIYKKNYTVKYCVGCELEKTDSELDNERCPIHPNVAIELIEEENYFFRYSKYQQALLDLYERNPHFVVPEGKLHEITEFTKRGLQDFSISRLKEKMPWGVPVPNDDQQVMYVWTDALVSYISALHWPDDEKSFTQFWPGMQVAGKDNLRQQSSMWQAMLLSAGLPTSSQIFIHGFITVGGQKMSKSLGNVVDPFELVAKYGVDAVRYYFLREITPTEDGDFTYEKFEERYRSDLSGGIGNLVARTIALAKKPTFDQKEVSEKIRHAVSGTEQAVYRHLEEFKFNDSLKDIWELVTVCDRHINEGKPWEGKENANQIISDVLFALQVIARCLEPFLPETAQKIHQAVTTKTSVILFPRREEGFTKKQ